MATEQDIRRYQQRCHADYAEDIGLPKVYTYPTGNPIRPVPPVQTKCGGLMIIGAYPSARFESRRSPATGLRRLIPIGDNLQPFGTEEYFDGSQVRRLESGAGLKAFLLEPLGRELQDCWITDLVKVFLYKPTHADSCADAVPGFRAPVLRDDFTNLAKRSVRWIQEEHELCRPRVVITLGEEVARVLTNETGTAEGILSPEPKRLQLFDEAVTYCCPHPDSCRRSPKWRSRMTQIVTAIKQQY